MSGRGLASVVAVAHINRLGSSLRIVALRILSMFSVTGFLIVNLYVELYHLENHWIFPEVMMESMSTIGAF